MENATILILLVVSLCVLETFSAEIDSITDSRFLTEEDTLVSPAGILELGFFRPDGSSENNRYLGIWYKKIPVKTVVWVANRDIPLTGVSSGLLRIISPGNLVLINNTNTTDVIWSSNTTSSGNTIVNLDDNGNLVMTDGNYNKILWQSFDYPTDTVLPAMKFGKVKGKEWHLSSWKSSQDPAPGEFTFSADTRGYPQLVVRQGAEIIYRRGPWNGKWISGDTQFSQNKIFTFTMLVNETATIFSYYLVNKSVISRLTINVSGHLERSVWVEDGHRWQTIRDYPKDTCDTYNTCGAYGVCNTVNSQTCSCLDETKFMPRNQKSWETADWFGGCVRRTPLDCKNRSDGFVKYSINLKLPDTQTSWYNMTMSLMECEKICQKNCTCMAYANTDISGNGSGCLLWFNDLIDIRILPEKTGVQDFYVRMASSELVAQSVFRKEGGTNIKVILIGVIVGVLMIALGTWILYACRKKYHSQPIEEGVLLNVGESHTESMELPLFSFSRVAKATALFSPDNKIGEGGFGAVYKGMLEEGQEIAVKRLSQTSSQGIDEFKNEVIFISKLQHRNLVKMLGCSIEGGEKLLIYEYMPNRDNMRSTLLDWKKRFNIIKGIARGLMYLHHDSRLRIIHRDLKASNILLDINMNPKISDFGIARSFGENETQGNTERVVGTYGYMSPEYALDGLFSTKSDAYSFGVLVLEIVTGKRNRVAYTEHNDNLIGYAWRMYCEGKSMELIDKTLAESSNPTEVLRSIEVGLLCVQQSPEDRPTTTQSVICYGILTRLHKKP